MADPDRGQRPLSPHLMIYRPQLTWISSILNRITGNGLLVGGLLLVWWLMAAATSPSYFAFVDGIVTSWIGDLVMAASVLALWYHALAGLRHLIWDAGYGLDIETAEKMGWGVIFGSVALTFVTLVAA